MNLTIYLKTSPPPEIQGGPGGGLKQKTTHPLQYKFSCQKNNDGQTNYKSAIIPSEHMKGA